jgi:hypothetical protein
MGALGWIGISGLVLGGLAALAIAGLDLWKRTVRLIPVLLLAVGGVLFNWKSGLPDQGMAFLLNAALVTAVLVMVWLALRMLRYPGFINKQIGIGDILFMYAMCTWMSQIGFALYFTSGLTITLLVVLLLLLLNRFPRDLPLPLAGALSLYALVFTPLYLIFETEILIFLEVS